MLFQFSVLEAGIQNRAMFEFPTSGTLNLNHNLTDNRGKALAGGVSSLKLCFWRNNLAFMPLGGRPQQQLYLQSPHKIF